LIEDFFTWIEKLTYLFITKDSFIFLGGLSSVLSLIISIVIYANIRNIKKETLIKIRGPEQFIELSEITSSINKYYQDFEDFQEDIDTELSKLEAILDWFKKFVKKNIKRNIKLIQVLINDFRDVNQNLQRKDNVWKIYTLLVKIDQQLGSLFKDKKWM